MMKYSHYRGICLFVFILLLRVPVIAQSTVISGRVITEDTRKPLDGAVVTIKTQRKLQAITDENGDFSFNARQLLVVLVVSYTGFETQEIRVAAKTGITILLKRDNRQLDEVVVTGYGTQNRKFIAGSISSVSGNDIRDIPEAGFNQLLCGAIILSMPLWILCM